MLTSAFEEEIPSTVSSQINIEGENFPDPNDVSTLEMGFGGVLWRLFFC